MTSGLHLDIVWERTRYPRSPRPGIEHQGTSIVQRRVGTPLVTNAEVLRLTDRAIHVRVELRTRGADDRLCSITVCRFARA